MSTSAIIRVEDSNNTWNLYVHSDGYEEYTGKLIKEAIKEAVEKDCNVTEKFSMDSLPNVSIDANRFFTFLVHKFPIDHGIYMIKNANIKKYSPDYLYEIKLDGKGKIGLKLND